MRFAVVGDICPDARLLAWRVARIPDLHRALDVDLVLANFEAVVDGTEVGDDTFAPDKIRLSVPGEALDRLRAIGVDAVSVANNHLWDYGAAAAEHTVRELGRTLGIDRVFGWNDRPSIEIASGLSVLGMCFDETHPERGGGSFAVRDTGDVWSAVAAARQPGESLLVFAHWGDEHVRLTDSLLRERAREMVGSGAAHVVGCHSHAVGAGERIGDAVALYGLGNLLFRTMPEHNTRMLPADRRGLAAVFRWEGGVLTYEECWESVFDDAMNLSLRPLGRPLPGGPVARRHLHLRKGSARALYHMDLGTTWARRGVAKVLSGIERPSWRKVGTLSSRVFGRRVA
ncbi:MAG: CapA family protein [Candidatus Eisenbacteria bacterium]